jgi:3-hydroxyisobutyrate dehydrogenase-like beta-hydroxyacid dehydrogenase
MCKNLVQKGNLDKSLIVYNRTSKKATDLAKRIGGCIIANSIQEAVERSDIIFSCLTDDDAVDAAFDIALKADIKGKLFVNCSTTEPKSSNALAERIEAAGGGIVTMPGIIHD